MRGFLHLSLVPLLALAGAVPAQATLRGPSPGAGTETLGSLLLVGPARELPIPIPGVRGPLGVVPRIVAPWSGSDPRGGLAALRAATSRSLFLQALTFPPGKLPRLSDLAELPPKGYGPSTGEISYPQAPTIEMTLSTQPIYNNFTRYLTFRTPYGAVKRQAIAFQKKSGLTWEGSLSGRGSVLRSLADTGNRAYWDDMRLENRGGSTTLQIARLKIVMNYDKAAGGCEKQIPIVNWTINKTLASGYSEIDLDYYAWLSRRSWAGLGRGTHQVARLAAADLGKSGSDWWDYRYPGKWNPQYNNGNSLLCSEFVSWYLHEAGVEVDGHDFKDITGTQAMHDIFRNAGRGYRYHNGLGYFIHADYNFPYVPQAGDFLERRGSGGAEHSMIMLRWDAVTKIATVINGPWPVTLRTINIQDSEVNDGKDYWIGRLPD